MGNNRNPRHIDILKRDPGKVLRNVKSSYVDNPFTHELIWAAARLVAKIADPALSAADAVALIIGSGSGVLSIDKIVAEASKDDPAENIRSRFGERWPKVNGFYADLLSYLLRAEQWGHHVSEASDELKRLARGRKSGENTMSASEIIHRVSDLDLKLYQNSPGYLLHLLLAPAARPGGVVADAVGGMYRRVRVRWHAAYRVAFGTFDVPLRPDVTLEMLSRAMVVLADGVALQATSTRGGLNGAGDSDAKMMAEIAMMLLVGVTDPGKTGVSLTDAVNALIYLADDCSETAQ